MGFAANPGRKGTELLRSLLSHRFVFDQKNAAVNRPCDELANLCAQFAHFARAIESETGAHAEVYSATSVLAREEAWRVVVKRSVSGAALGRCGITAATHKSMEELMRATEKWSLELQRHCASDWNQCSSVLLHCLTEVTKKERAASFEV